MVIFQPPNPLRIALEVRPGIETGTPCKYGPAVLALQAAIQQGKFDLNLQSYRRAK